MEERLLPTNNQFGRSENYYISPFENMAKIVYKVNIKLLVKILVGLGMTSGFNGCTYGQQIIVPLVLLFQFIHFWSIVGILHFIVTAKIKAKASRTDSEKGGVLS